MWIFSGRRETGCSRAIRTDTTPDGLHPNSEGYRIRYEELRKQTGIVEIPGKGPERPEKIKKGHPPSPKRDVTGNGG